MVRARFRPLRCWIAAVAAARSGIAAVAAACSGIAAVAAACAAPPRPSLDPATASHPSADPSTSPAAAAAPVTAAAPAARPTERWVTPDGQRRLVAERFSLELAAPTGMDFRVVPSRHWFSLVDERREAALRLRTFAAPRAGALEPCAEALALWSPAFAALSSDQVLERRRLELPRDFSSELVVWVRDQPDCCDGRAVVGHVALIGKRRNECLVGLFETSAAGADAAERVARRLAWAAEVWLPTLRRLGVEDRVQRRAGP